jgi:hypothetical protein
MKQLRKGWAWLCERVTRSGGDTRTKEVRDAPFGCLEMTFSGNRHRREAEELRQAHRNVTTTHLDNTYIKDEDIVQMVERVTARTPLEIDTRWKALVDAGLFDPRCNLNGMGITWTFLATPEIKELRGWRYPIVSVVPTFILTESGATVDPLDPLSYPEGNVILEKLLTHIQKQNLIEKESE